MRKSVCGITQGIPVMIMGFLLILPLHAAEFAGGTGEPNNPYQIATAGQLVAIGSDPNLLDKHFVLIVDIDLDPNLPGGKVFERAVIAPRLDNDDPRYPQDTPFSGVLDGGGHAVRNLTIQGGSYLGLFGRNSGTIRNLGVVDARITGSGDNVGVLVGHSPGIVTECRCSGDVVGGSRVGGVVGILMAGRVIRCRSEVEVTALGESAGGLVGYNATGRILMSCSTGSVCGDRYVGGAVGTNEEGFVVHCYATGAVTGSMCVAGLVGRNRGAFVIQCYSTGLVTGGSGAGGLIGWHSGGGRTRGGIDGCFWDTESSGQPTSGAGMGRTTAQMHDIETFLAAGWDFIGETHNGTCGYWHMPAGGYPRLCCHDGVAPVMPEGSGTAAEPYLIRDANDLGVVWFEPQAHYRLENSLDLSGIVWSVAVVPWFEGVFDGNGHVISNLHIEGNSYLGLFGESCPEAALFNLGLETVDVNGTGNYVGALVGNNRGGIASCSSTGTIAGAWQVGGLAGGNEGSITDSQTTGAVLADRDEVGGLVGNNFGSVATSHSAGVVSGHSNLGGLVGRNTGDIDASYSTADVEGVNSCIGGLVGLHSNRITQSISGHVEFHAGTITRSHSSGRVLGQFTVGGLVGQNGADVVASHSSNTVGGNKYVGGLVGYNEDDITACYSSSMVNADNYVGGLAGYNMGSITDSYCTGAVSGNDNVGGLVGFNSNHAMGSIVNGRITMCYSAATVQGHGSVGGLVGSGREGNYVTASFWDVETSGQAASFAGTGKTTAEMQTAATFLDAGWDFAGETINGAADIWWIFEGQDYPRLWWEHDESRI